MNKKILLTMIVSVMTSLGCRAYEIYDKEYVWHKIDGDTATIIGSNDDMVTQIYHLKPSPIFVMDLTNDTFPVTAVETLKTEKRKYKGLSDLGSISIKLPTSVRQIGDSAMTDNWQLELLELPGVEIIGKEGLSNNIHLKEIIWLRKHLRSFGSGAFRNCRSLQDIWLGLPFALLARMRLRDVKA